MSKLIYIHSDILHSIKNELTKTIHKINCIKVRGGEADTQANTLYDSISVKDQNEVKLVYVLRSQHRSDHWRGSE